MAGGGPSLTYQILLYCNAWYFAAYAIFELLILIYKSQVLPYPRYYLATEYILITLLILIEIVRNFFGQKGNLTTQMVPVVFSLVLTVPGFVGTLYFLLWQTYVLRIEMITASIQILFLLFELVFGVVAIATFARASPI